MYLKSFVTLTFEEGFFLETDLVEALNTMYWNMHVQLKG